MCIKSDNLHINSIKFDNYFVTLQTNIILVYCFYYVFMFLEKIQS